MNEAIFSFDVQISKFKIEMSLQEENTEATDSRFIDRTCTFLWLISIYKIQPSNHAALLPILNS